MTSSSPSRYEPSEEEVKLAAKIIAATPLIDAPKLKWQSWMGLARKVLERSVRYTQSESAASEGYPGIAHDLGTARRLLRTAYEQCCGMTQQLYPEDHATFGAPSYLIEIEQYLDAAPGALQPSDQGRGVDGAAQPTAGSREVATTPPVAAPTDKPQTSYVPLTEEEIERVRSVYKRHFSDGERLDIVCDMAINSLLFSREIDRLRSLRSAERDTQHGEASAPTIAGDLSETEPDGNEGRSGEVDREGGRSAASARGDAVGAGSSECGPRPSGGEADREDLSVAGGAVSAPSHVAATPGQQQPTSQDVRDALLFCLWHHQGGGSKIGQPIRAALGIGPNAPLDDAQLAAAKRVQSALCTPSATGSLPEAACKALVRDMKKDET